jgi:hypothetical protein
MAKRVPYRLELTAPAKQSLAKVSDYYGMTERAMMARIVEWLLRQPEKMQAAVLLTFPPDVKADMIKLLLNRS